MITLNLLINDHVIPQSFHILHHPPTSLILGMDFLQTQEAKLDIAAQTLTIKDEDINLSSPANCTALLRTCYKFTVPACSDALFLTKPSKRQLPGSNQSLLIQPLPSQKLPVLTARLVTSNNKDRQICRVFNPTDKDVIVPTNHPIAKNSYLSEENILP